MCHIVIYAEFVLAASDAYTYLNNIIEKNRIDNICKQFYKLESLEAISVVQEVPDDMERRG